MEVRGDQVEVQKNYRAVLSLDPTCEPVIRNIQRSTEGGWRQTGTILVGEGTKEGK